MKKTHTLALISAGLLAMPNGGWCEDKAPENVKDTARVESSGEKDDPKDIQNKLLKLTTLENAFKRALQKRNLLRRLIALENGKLTESTDEAEKAEARKNIGNARKELHKLQMAMDVVFSTGNRRDYQYNEVDSTIYLKIGTVEEAFARTVRTRDALSKALAETRKNLESEKDEAKKPDLEKRLAQLRRQYQMVAAALQVIYKVTPVRNYEYNPKNSTLYLKVSENEVEDLRDQARKLREEEAKNAGSAESEPAKDDTKPKK